MKEIQPSRNIVSFVFLNCLVGKETLIYRCTNKCPMLVSLCQVGGRVSVGEAQHFRYHHRTYSPNYCR